jgi:DNA-binding CsgD family transcriptional regulator
LDPRAASRAVATAAEAARDPALWGEVAVRTAEALGGDTASVAFFGADGSVFARACPQTDPALHGRYDADLHALNYLWTGAATLPAGRAANETMLGGREAYLRSAIFNEFIRPQEADGIMLLTLTGRGAPVEGILTVGRRARRDPFDGDDLADGAAIAHALARTIAATGATWRLAPDREVWSVEVLVTPEGRLLTHPPGLDGLTRAGVMTVRNGLLSAELLPRLATALGAAGRDPADWPPPVGMILGPIATPLGSLRIAVMPGGTSAPGAVRLTIDPLPEAAPVALLAGRYRLTPRETDIAVCLGQGRTLPEAADALGIGLSTARTHLMRIFDKTGTRTQLALALLIARHLDGRRA